MKLAAVSDIHLADDNCTILMRDGSLGPKFNAFAKAVGKSNDYLVLLGDIFDLALRSYAEVYGLARRFLHEVKDRGLATEIIYVPGNHDYDAWHSIEHEVNVINRINKQRGARQFRWSVPGLLDDRIRKRRDKFMLPDVTAGASANKPRFGDIFLSKLCPGLNFNVAYPNLYLVTKTGECVLMTHGHYLEAYWTMLGELAPKVFGDDLQLAARGEPDLREMAAMNFPTNQLASSGVGQAGPLTPLVRKVQRQAKDKVVKHIKRYLDNLDDELLDRIYEGIFIDPVEWATDGFISLMKGLVVKKIESMQLARYDEQFMSREDVRDRFGRYYHASLKEIARLNTMSEVTGGNIPKPRRVIFGHTHQPVEWKDKRVRYEAPGRNVYLHNSGGWLTRKGATGEEFCGAAVFRYETSKGFSTVIVD